MIIPQFTVQFQCLNKGHFSVADDVRRSLTNARVGVSEDDSSSLNCTLITFNDGTNLAELHAVIADKRQNQGHRVIAINLTEVPLNQQKIWDLLTHGAQEVLNWRTDPPMATKIIVARLERWAQIERLLGSSKVTDVLRGSSAAWRLVLREVIEISAFSQSSVLIMGESGTGKELVARLIHSLDVRPFKQELVLLDCSSVVPELSGSEFFGHEKGAFTNAISTRDGAFSLADKGTLFLDEIGELPLHLLAELLRVIQEGMYKRVGSNSWKQTHFRFVGATNRDLLTEVKQKRFREDLYYRISTWVCTLPPLRERRDDIPELARHFLRQVLQTDKTPIIDPAVMSYLETRDYPGNIRELRQLMTRIAHRHVGNQPITVGDIPEMDRPHAAFLSNPLSKSDFVNAIHVAMKRGLGLKEIVADISNIAKDLAIHDADGNLQIAAQALNVTDRTLQAYQASKRNGSDGMPSVGGGH